MSTLDLAFAEMEWLYAEAQQSTDTNGAIVRRFMERHPGTPFDADGIRQLHSIVIRVRLNPAAMQHRLEELREAHHHAV